MSVTFGDVYRPYVKPSLEGRLVLRKRNSRQTSQKLKQRQMKVAQAKPPVIAKERCRAEGKEVNGRCPINVFRRYLREAMMQVK